LYVGSKLVMAADNDRFTDNNPGMRAASTAAHAVHGLVVHPEFSEAEVLAGKPTDFNDLHVLRGLDAVRDRIEMVTAPVREAMGFPFTQVDELEIKPVNWLIKGYIEADSLAQVFGDPGGGKSFVAIDMACCVATGTDWHGHKVKNAGAVFYIAGEGHNGLAKRFKAWELGTGVSLKGAPIYKSHRAAQLYDATEAAQVAQSINQLVGAKGVQPALIVIDTLARNMGGDENSTQDMNTFIHHLDTYLKSVYKCCVMVVHHSGTADKDRGRGSSAMKGAIDAEYKVAIDDASKMVKLTPKKMKEADVPAEKSFSLTRVDLNILNDEGESEMGAHLVSVDISGLIDIANARHKFLGGSQGVALKCLVSLEYASNIKKERGEFAPPIDRDTWRESCKEAGIDQKNFSRVVKNLLEKGVVVTRDDEIFFTSENSINHLKPPQTTSIEATEVKQ